MYDIQFVKVRYFAHYSNEWKISSGVRQGGVLSGLLFSIYIDSLITKISHMRIGCRLALTSSNIIAYADDLVLLAPSHAGLQIIINEAMKESVKIGLKFNQKKTKCMVFHSSKKHISDRTIKQFVINDHPIEFVTDFKYLGIIASGDLRDD